MLWLQHCVIVTLSITQSLLSSGFILGYISSVKSESHLIKILHIMQSNLDIISGRAWKLYQRHQLPNYMDLHNVSWLIAINHDCAGQSMDYKGE